MSLGVAEPVSANTPIAPAPPLPLGGSETRDQCPSAVTATPNGSPGTGDSRVSPAGSCRPGALAALQPGTATLDTTRLVDVGRGDGAARGVPELQAVSASVRAATAMAGRPESRTPPTLAPLARPAAQPSFRRPAGPAKKCTGMSGA